MRELGNLERRELGGWLNNQAESSHLPFRRREWTILRFRQWKSPQGFDSVHTNVRNHFIIERHLIDRQAFKTRRSAAVAEWHSLMG